MNLPIVIIGGGQAALEVAETLRVSGVVERIVLIGDQPHPPCQRPPVSKKLLLDEIAEARLWLQSPNVDKRKEIEPVAGSSDGVTRSIVRGDTENGGFSIDDDGVPIAVDAANDAKAHKSAHHALSTSHPLALEESP